MTRLLLHSDNAASTESRIYHYIYEEKSISRTAIAHHLRLSLPTVTQHLTTLLEGGIISKGDMCDSTGGRKAQSYEFNAAYHCAVGIDIWIDCYQMVVLDLYGNILYKSTVSLSFENSDLYYDRLASSVLSQVQASSLDTSLILGIGISLQGIISPDGDRVIYGDAMNTVGMERQRFADLFPWPVLLIHNVDAAAYAESWYHQDLGNAFYLFLCDYFGASLIIDGHPYLGDTGTGSTIEHMCLVPDGQSCYCGKRGCVEAYCSEQALLAQAQESKEVFFDNLRQGRKFEVNIWSDYLKKIALVIDNIRMVIHSQVIIGGTLAAYLQDDDFIQLEKYVQEISSFRSSGHFISKGICGKRSSAKGAALQFIMKYLNER